MSESTTKPVTPPGKSGSGTAGDHSHGGGGGGGTAIVTNQPLLLVDHVTLGHLDHHARHRLAVVQAKFALAVSNANVTAYADLLEILQSNVPPRFVQVEQ